MSALQREMMAKSLEGRRRGSDDEKQSIMGQKFAAYRRALAAGMVKERIIRIPVILHPDSPVSAEELQQLAEQDSVPETIDTKVVEEGGVRTERPVKIALVTFEEHERLERKADVLGYIQSGTTVLVDGKERYATKIRSLKRDGVSLPEGASQDTACHDCGSGNESLVEGGR
ncbi:hypothetical protein VTH82DRAFT_2436 [Thermothelomyces myriococcoides]